MKKIISITLATLITFNSYLIFPNFVVHAQSGTRPNIVVIMTDDQDDMGSLSVMAKTKNLLIDNGVRFLNSFVDNSVCCPSRATMITGQYSHNHSILDIEPPLGGYGKLVPTAGNTLPVWLHNAGYKTALIGKYLNGYGTEVPATNVPPGWDFWRGLVDKSTYLYYGYTVNADGTLHTYGTTPADYQTDVLAQKAANFINLQATSSQPFFLWLTPMAPHLPINGNTNNPTPRYGGMFSSLALPRSPSFNEADMSDKPSFMQSRPLIDGATIDSTQSDFRYQRERLMAVDDMVKTVFDALQSSGKLDNTVIIFTSDNGFFNGEHRLPTNKRLVYEESVRVPLIIRGPGIPHGQTRNNLVINVDVPATVMDLAGISSPGRMPDGKSLTPLLQNASSPWRTAILLQGLDKLPPQTSPAFGTYQAVRTDQYKYVEHKMANGSTERELYDLKNDPYELSSKQNDPSYSSVISSLSTTLNTLKTCAGESCWIGPQPLKPGDLNTDGKVNVSDYQLFLPNFGKTGSNTVGDIDGNGKVDIFDYSELVGNFGK